MLADCEIAAAKEESKFPAKFKLYINIYHHTISVHYTVYLIGQVVGWYSAP